MQINSITNNQATNFESRMGTRLQRSLTRAQRDLFAKAAEQTQKLSSDINSMVYTKALDFRQMMGADAKARLEVINKALNLIVGKN